MCDSAQYIHDAEWTIDSSILNFIIDNDDLTEEQQVVKACIFINYLNRIQFLWIRIERSIQKLFRSLKTSLQYRGQKTVSDHSLFIDK